MRALLFIAGILLAALGFLAFQGSKDPLLLQGGLTLGGGFVICGIFSIRAKWHGIAGAGLLAFLGFIRTVPSVVSGEKGPAAPFMLGAATICLVVLISVIQTFRAERTRRSIEKLKAGVE
ncbi:hypothetical protein [Luteolibacter luteus]|uniref:Integral membrane protein n=1 Tax=Luteolibacter luteus TaxID=2728835 RepID=A0A858REP8_9BACT|nr:hypothetical protein [Luteolibacter luteus]QJE94879.1 hypothetical protein HHL09_03490 [Luteolibacter luteus]